MAAYHDTKADPKSSNKGPSHSKPTAFATSNLNHNPVLAQANILRGCDTNRAQMHGPRNGKRGRRTRWIPLGRDHVRPWLPAGKKQIPSMDFNPQPIHGTMAFSWTLKPKHPKYNQQKSTAVAKPQPIHPRAKVSTGCESDPNRSCAEATYPSKDHTSSLAPKTPPRSKYQKAGRSRLNPCVPDFVPSRLMQLDCSSDTSSDDTTDPVGSSQRYATPASSISDRVLSASSWPSPKYSPEEFSAAEDEGNTTDFFGPNLSFDEARFQESLVPELVMDGIDYGIQNEVREKLGIYIKQKARGLSGGALDAADIKCLRKCLLFDVVIRAQLRSELKRMQGMCRLEAIWR